MSHWYLLRTKSGGERLAEQQLAKLVESTLLPLGRTQIRQRDRTIERTVPLFPCYLFAFFSLAALARRIRYTPGVREIVQFGDQAAMVPDWVINYLMARCGDGPVELSRDSLRPGALVRLIAGPFQDFDAVFDCYLGGAERVAVLLSVMNGARRVVMPAAMVVPA